MTQRKDKAGEIKWKELIGNQEDFLRPLVREVIQQVLEAEMEEAVGAGKENEQPNGWDTERAIMDGTGHAGGETGVTGTARSTRGAPD